LWENNRHAAKVSPNSSQLQDINALKANSMALIFGDTGGFAKRDRKKQCANDAGKNKDVSDSFHG
jgi:hypothetical protein